MNYIWSLLEVASVVIESLFSTKKTKVPELTKGSMKVLEQSAFAVQCDIYRFLKRKYIVLLHMQHLCVTFSLLYHLCCFRLLINSSLF